MGAKGTSAHTGAVAQVLMFAEKFFESAWKVGAEGTSADTGAVVHVPTLSETVFRLCAEGEYREMSADT